MVELNCWCWRVTKYTLVRCGFPLNSINWFELCLRSSRDLLILKLVQTTGNTKLTLQLVGMTDGSRRSVARKREQIYVTWCQSIMGTYVLDCSPSRLYQVALKQPFEPEAGETHKSISSVLLFDPIDFALSAHCDSSPVFLHLHFGLLTSLKATTFTSISGSDWIYSKFTVIWDSVSCYNHLFKWNWGFWKVNLDCTHALARVIKHRVALKFSSCVANLLNFILLLWTLSGGTLQWIVFASVFAFDEYLGKNGIFSQLTIGGVESLFWFFA